MSDDHFPTVRLTRAPALHEQDRAAKFRWTFSSMLISWRSPSPDEAQPDPFHSPTQRSNFFIASSWAAGGVGA